MQRAHVLLQSITTSLDIDLLQTLLKLFHIRHHVLTALLCHGLFDAALDAVLCTGTQLAAGLSSHAITAGPL